MKNDKNQIDFDAKKHYEDICKAIDIDYSSLIKYNYSDKCYYSSKV